MVGDFDKINDLLSLEAEEGISSAEEQLIKQ